MAIFKVASETEWELFGIALWRIFGRTDSGPVYSETSQLPIKEAVTSRKSPIMQYDDTVPGLKRRPENGRYEQKDSSALVPSTLFVSRHTHFIFYLQECRIS